VTGENLAAAIRRAHAAFGEKPLWRQLQANAMARDVSWRGQAGRYAGLYREIAAHRSASAAHRTTGV
jgi:starch synthase